MMPQRRYPRRSQRGVVLLMALMALLLIAAIGAAILFMSMSESSFVASQRTTTRAYEAALGGLGEARARLSGSDPSFIGPPATFPSTNISKTIPFPTSVGQVLYILNPFPAGEFTIANVRTLGSPYYDWEYNLEWGAGALAAAVVVNPTPPPATPLTSDMVALRSKVALPDISYKWVRITILTERAANRDINGDGVLNNTIPVFWDQMTNRMNVLPPGPNRPGRMVYRITAFALIRATGATRMVQVDVGQPVPLTIDSALRAGPGASFSGPTLNIKGDSDPICARPGNFGARAGGSFTIPGGSTGNITGNGQQPNQKNAPDPLPYSVPTLINIFKPGATQINPVSPPPPPPPPPTSPNYEDPTTHVRFGPPSCLVNEYCGPQAVLGTPPTFNPAVYTGGDISEITAPGTPITYYSPGNLTLGASPGGAKISGQGVLLVDGDLTIDTSFGFNYFGLILVRGNIIVKSTAATPQPMVIHGAVIAGGTFDARPLSQSPGSGQVEIQMNACFVENQLDFLPRPILAYREIAQ